MKILLLPARQFAEPHSCTGDNSIQPLELQIQENTKLLQSLLQLRVFISKWVRRFLN